MISTVNMFNRAAKFYTALLEIPFASHKRLVAWWDKYKRLYPIFVREDYLWTSPDGFIFTWDRANTIWTYRWRSPEKGWVALKCLHNPAPLANWHAAFMFMRQWHEGIFK